MTQTSSPKHDLWCKITCTRHLLFRCIVLLDKYPVIKLKPSPPALPADSMTDWTGPCAAVQRGGRAAPCGLPSWLTPSCAVSLPRPSGVLARASAAPRPPEPCWDERTLGFISLPGEKTQTSQELMLFQSSTEQSSCALFNVCLNVKGPQGGGDKNNAHCWLVMFPN